MRKLILLTVGLVLSAQLSAQNLEFTLNKGVVVGCSGANALTDAAKKINLSLEGDKATLSYASLNCSKTIKCVNYGVIQEGTQSILYFNEQEKKGCIVEKNEKIVLFSQKNAVYEILAVGHTDKKQAKMISVESENPVFTPILGNLENVLAKAKEQKLAAERVQKMAKMPTTEFKDEYGVSGVYYLSETVHDKKNDKYVSEVNLQFEVAAGNLKIHYHDGLFDEAYIEQIYKKPLKEKSLSYIYFKGNNMTNIPLFENHVLQPLEKDIYLVSMGSYSNDTRLDCSSVKIIEKKDASGKPIHDYVIVGKDKKRVEELRGDHAQVEKLYIASCIAMCESYNAVRAGKTPMPSRGMTDVKLISEALGFIKKEAAARNWPQTVDHCYLKSNDWVVTRNITTGLPVYRTLVFVTVLTSNGKCQWEESFLKQDYDGSGYGKSYFAGNSGNLVPVDCTDAMKYKNK